METLVPPQAKQLALLDDSIVDLGVLHSGHWETTKRFGRIDKYIGVPVVVLSAIVGTALFATIEPSADADPSVNMWQLGAGIIAMVAAVLAGLQTFLNYSERSAQHKRAGILFGALKRRAELLRAAPPDTNDELRAAITDLDNDWTDAADSSPPIPSRLFNKKKQQQAEKERQSAARESP